MEALNIKPIEILDQALFQLAVKANHTMTLDELHSAIHYDNGLALNLTKEVLQQALNKLEKDGFTYSFNDYIPIPKTLVTHHRLTFEGHYFADQRGYKGKFLRDDAENMRERILADRQIELDERISRLTVIIAVGTGVAALYYFLEILRIQYHLGLPNHIFFQ